MGEKRVDVKVFSRLLRCDYSRLGIACFGFLSRSRSPHPSFISPINFPNFIVSPFSGPGGSATNTTHTRATTHDASQPHPIRTADSHLLPSQSWKPRWLPTLCTHRPPRIFLDGRPPPLMQLVPLWRGTARERAWKIVAMFLSCGGDGDE